ncbi:hypothetical protein SAMN05216258_107341 [Albimonas pacifica]|uniref:Uncharacterized protein n=1 Tax=Albimonas pacifica TaxID=1114924 RepID=A0A1I3J3U3_9RHOB|nr:DUF6324 family protein [Albimonas pacifica]SFI54628.1 hypothetical protein SAMN05216258_107341 [Albimonas pacifica]
MGIDSESDVAASLQIGPTSEGMVRIYVEGEGFSLPLDFHPEEAEEIAEELMGAAERARGASKRGGAGRPKAGGQPKGPGRGPGAKPGRGPGRGPGGGGRPDRGR